MVTDLEQIFQTPAVTSYATEPNVSDGGELYLEIGLQATTDEATYAIGYDDPYEMAQDLDLPLEIDGIKCRYFFEGKIYAGSAASKYRPVIGGISVASIGIGFGTAGGVVWDALDAARQYLITNRHVVDATYSPSVGDVVLQPGPGDGGVSPADVIGTLDRWSVMAEGDSITTNNRVDAALINPSVDVTADYYRLLGDVSARPYRNPISNTVVTKEGRTTGVTEGTVSSTSLNVSITYSPWNKTILVKSVFRVSDAGHTFFTNGDSGSRVWHKDTMSPLGLAFAFNSSLGYTYVIKALEIEKEMLIKWYNQTKLSLFSTLDLFDNVYAMSFSPKGKYVVIGHHQYLALFESTNGILNELDSFFVPGLVSNCDFSPDGKYAVVTYSGNKLYLLDVSGGTLTLVATYQHGANMRGVAFSPNGEYIAFGGGNNYPTLAMTGLLKIVGNELHLVGSSSRPSDSEAVAYSKSGEYIAVGGTATSGVEQKFQLLRQVGDSLQHIAYVHETLEWSSAIVYSIDFSPDGNYIAMGYNAGNVASNGLTILRLENDTLTVVSTYNLPGAARCVRFSPDGKLLAVAHSGYPFMTILKHDSGSVEFYESYALASTSSACSFSPTGQYAIFGGSGSPDTHVFELPEPPPPDERLPNYPPTSYLRMQFTAGDSDPFQMGRFYIDRTDATVGDPTVRIDGRNTIGKLLRDQSIDEGYRFPAKPITQQFVSILQLAGVTKYYVATDSTEVGLEFTPDTKLLTCVEEFLKYVRGWAVKEKADGTVVIAPRDDPAHDQPSRYTFMRNRDIFSRQQIKDDGQTFGRVCVHTQDWSVAVYRPVPSTLGWLPPSQKTYFEQVPEGTTQFEAAALASELAERLGNSGEVETFIGPFRPHLLPGDEAEILNADGPVLLGTITTVVHRFGKAGFLTEVTIDSGGKIGRPRFSEYLAELIGAKGTAVKL